jgi:hypothetical protein
MLLLCLLFVLSCDSPLIPPTYDVDFYEDMDNKVCSPEYNEIY